MKEEKKTTKKERNKTETDINGKQADRDRHERARRMRMGCTQIEEGGG